MHKRKHQISTPASPTNAADPSPSEDSRPDPEVVATAKRRTFFKTEKLRILAAANACVLNSPRFANCAPASIHAKLLDEGRYVASVHTMCRLLKDCDAVRAPRNQMRHPERNVARRRSNWCAL